MSNTDAKLIDAVRDAIEKEDAAEAILEQCREETTAALEAAVATHSIRELGRLTERGDAWVRWRISRDVIDASRREREAALERWGGEFLSPSTGVTIVDAARILGVTRVTVKARMNRGELPYLLTPTGRPLVLIDPTGSLVDPPEGWVRGEDVDRRAVVYRAPGDTGANST